MNPNGVQALHTQVPGRARLKVAGLYRSSSMRTALERELACEPGVRRVSASELTSNVLVVFDASLPLERIVALVEVVATSARIDTQPRRSDVPLKPGVPGPIELLRDAATRGRRVAAEGRAIRHMVRVAEEPAQRPWHLLDRAAALSEFGTDPDSGLSTVSAQALLERFGPNVLREAVPRSSLSIFLGQFNSAPVWLLGASAAISLATGGLADAAVIAAVVMLNATIGFVTERQAERTIGALTRSVQTGAHVLRGRKVIAVRPEYVVPGDLLVLAPGRYIAADARVIHANNLTVDESALTGESLPVQKSVEPMHADTVALADRVNMVYMGTLVTGGNGLAVVSATGANTELGRIQALVGATRTPATPMQKQLEHTGNQLVVLSSALCAGVFVIGLVRGRGFVPMLKAAISLAVAAVPEGLPTVATTTLALGIADMRRRRVLIRHLNAVETLGSVQVICLDKTGTLTENRMSVVAAFSGLSTLDVVNGHFRSGRHDVDPFGIDLLRMLHVAVLCNECDVAGAKGAWVVQGTATEAALVELALAAGVDVIEVRRRHPLLQVEYRAENRLFMRTLHAAASGRRVIAVKGSPPEVLALCHWHLRNGRLQVLDDEARDAIMRENERMAGQALRVLGFACGVGDGESPEAAGENGLAWLGLLAMADPVREGVHDLIRTFHRAGIETVMITGDQSATAHAIGHGLGLSGDKPLEILDSTSLERMDPALLTALAQRVHVFARVSPAQKLQIVQALQRAGKVVAMTGDGINDGPALKTADIGVAMGHAGTDVARTVASVVLEDDDLQTMIVAISEGRTVYNNIRKAIHYLLATNLAEVEVMTLSLAAGLGQPLSPMQLLWINLITDIFPALALAVEPPEPDVLLRAPRDPAEPIVTRGELRRVALESAAITTGAMAAYGVGMTRYGPGPAANTMAFMTLASAQILHALVCRSPCRTLFTERRLPGNPYLDLALGGSLLAQSSCLIVPGIRNFLGLAPLRLADLAVVAAGALLPSIIAEITKPAATSTASPGTEG